MKITIAGSLGNVSKPLAELLIARGHEVTVITSTPERKNAITQIGATAAVGSVLDAGFLSRAFQGADAVYTMTPAMGHTLIANIISAGNAYAEAISSTGVKRVVMLSSLGADVPEGKTPITGLHHVEERFSQLEGVNVTLLRAGFFYSNYFRDIPLIKNANILGSNYPGSIELPLVHPRDIAAAAAEELQSSGEARKIRYVVSDLHTGNEVASLLGASIGKADLQWAEFTDEQLADGIVKAGLPPSIAEIYVEIGKDVRSGAITKDFYISDAPVTGKIKFPEFTKEFAAAFLQ